MNFVQEGLAGPILVLGIGIGGTILLGMGTLHLIRLIGCYFRAKMKFRHLPNSKNRKEAIKAYISERI
jgi:hypothetical protein